MSNTIQRTAILTGTASDRGIGFTTARRYARKDPAVVILDLEGEESTTIAARIGNEFNVPACGHEMDVSNQAAVTAQMDADDLPPVGARPT